MFGEPPRTQYDVNFRLFGFPVRIHPYFWLVALFLAYQAKTKDAGSVAIVVVAVSLSILVHELGHAVVVRAYGWQPWITLYGFGGLTSYESRDYSRPSGSEPLGQVLISLAGPVAGLMLAAALLLVVILAGYGSKIYVGPWRVIPQALLPNPRIDEFCNQVLFISVAWGLVNLMPIYPLDGGQIAREILLEYNPHNGIRRSLWLSVVAGCLMAFVAIVQWQSPLSAVLFGSLAYSSYAALRDYEGRRPW